MMKNRNKMPRTKKADRSGNRPSRKREGGGTVITDELKSEIALLHPDENSLDRG